MHYRQSGGERKNGGFSGKSLFDRKGTRGFTDEGYADFVVKMSDRLTDFHGYFVREYVI